MPAVFPTFAQGGAKPTFFDEDVVEYDKAVLVHEFKDGSASYARQATVGIRFFMFDYENLTQAEAATHDGHYNSCFGKWLGFELIHPRTGESIQNVHYEKYEYNKKTRLWVKGRTVVLVKRPISI